MALKFKIGESSAVKNSETVIKSAQSGAPQKGIINIQDQFLNSLRREGKYIIVTLMNGEKMNGKIYGFDTFSIILESDGKTLIYKHGISTITVDGNTDGQQENK